MNKPREIKRILKPLNAVIQICPNCGKIDAYKNDGHSCEAEIARQINREMADL